MFGNDSAFHRSLILVGTGPKRLERATGELSGYLLQDRHRRMHHFLAPETREKAEMAGSRRWVQEPCTHLTWRFWSISVSPRFGVARRRANAAPATSRAPTPQAPLRHVGPPSCVDRRSSKPQRTRQDEARKRGGGFSSWSPPERGLRLQLIRSQVEAHGRPVCHRVRATRLATFEEPAGSCR